MTAIATNPWPGSWPVPSALLSNQHRKYYQLLHSTFFGFLFLISLLAHWVFPSTVMYRIPISISYHLFSVLIPKTSTMCGLNSSQTVKLPSTHGRWTANFQSALFPGLFISGIPYHLSSSANWYQTYHCHKSMQDKTRYNHEPCTALSINHWLLRHQVIYFLARGYDMGWWLYHLLFPGQSGL